MLTTTDTCDAVWCARQVMEEIDDGGIAAIVAACVVVGLPILLTTVCGCLCAVSPKQTRTAQQLAGGRCGLFLAVVKHPFSFWRWVFTFVLPFVCNSRRRTLKRGSEFLDVNVYKPDGSATTLGAYLPDAGKPLVLNLGSWS